MSQEDELVLPEYDNPVVQSWFVTFLRGKIAARLGVPPEEVVLVYDLYDGIGERSFHRWRREFERMMLVASHGVVVYRDVLKRERYGLKRIWMNKLRKQKILSLLHQHEKGGRG